MTRAVVLPRFGAPVEVREFPAPRPTPGGMIVAPDYGGICGTDIHLGQGHLPIPTPIVLGHEGLGRVHELDDSSAVDANGDKLEPGDVVMWASSIACGRCEPCLLHREATLCVNRRTYGVNRPVAEHPFSGAWAELISLHAGTTVVKVPDSVDPLVAMAFACAGPTLVHALFERRPVRVGETVIVQGSGPVGLAAAALATLAGAAKVIVLGGPTGRLDVAKAAGIGDAHVDLVSAQDPEQALEEARELAGGGADLVIECAGAPVAVAQGLRLPRRGGAYLVVGQYTDSGDTMINPHQIVFRQLDVIGSWAFTGAHVVEYVRLLPALTRRFDLAKLVTTFPLVEAERAMRAVADGTVLKAVLEVGTWP